MSNYNNKHHDDGNPFYNEPIHQTSPNQQQQQQQQHLFTNTNIDYNDYSQNRNTGQQPAYQPDLQFQNFSHNVDINSQQPNKIGGNNSNNNNRGGMYPPDNVPLTGNNNINNSSNLNEDGTEKKYSFYEVPYYRFLFNVDTKEVGLRLLRSMLPIKFSFFNLIRENPDLYGPFWILTTLVFVVAASSNLNTYFNSDHSTWEVDIKKIVYSSIAIYGYSFIIPLILWGIFKWMNLGLRLLDMLCIYGYTLFIYIPASILCVIPYALVQWIIVAAAALISGLFLVSNIFTPLKEDFTKRGLIICAVIGALHLGLALVLKLYFFANSTEDFSDFTPSPTPTPTPTNSTIPA